MQITISDDEIARFLYDGNYPFIKSISKHMRHFIAYNCAEDILARKIFPNGKEITESMAAFEGVRKHIVRSDKLLKKKDITLVSVGDGNTPRTAALFAFLTKWQCVSIDPNMKEGIDWEVDRLKIYKSRVEDLDLHYDDVIIVGVHSHATMKATLFNITGDRRSLLAIPCCVPYRDYPPTIEYRDYAIWSPKNTVKIWRNI